jgi:hypothetical protein
MEESHRGLAEGFMIEHTRFSGYHNVGRTSCAICHVSVRSTEMMKPSLEESIRL